MHMMAHDVIIEWQIKVDTANTITNEVSQTLVESSSFNIQTSTMFNLTHTFPIFSLLGLFMVTEGRLEAYGPVIRCVRMKTLTSKNAS